MKIRYAEVRVRLSETHIRNTLVPEWEAPLLQAVHGEHATLTGKFVDKERDYIPDASSEFERLANRYQSPENSETPYVGLVYGAFGAAKLQEAIDAGTIEEKAPKSRKKVEKTEKDPVKTPGKDNLKSLLNEGGE